MTGAVRVATKEGYRFGMNLATMNARWWDGYRLRLITVLPSASECIVGARAAGLRRLQKIARLHHEAADFVVTLFCLVKTAPTSKPHEW